VFGPFENGFLIIVAYVVSFNLMVNNVVLFCVYLPGFTWNTSDPYMGPVGCKRFKPKGSSTFLGGF